MTGSNPHGIPGDDRPETSGQPGMTNPAGRRRGRILLPAAFLGIIVLIFLIILLVGGQLGR